jgi:hypothetical protein
MTTGRGIASFGLAYLAAQVIHAFITSSTYHNFTDKAAFIAGLILIVLFWAAVTYGRDAEGE